MQDKMERYYRYAPEYQVRISESEERTAYEFYMFNGLVRSPSWFMATLYYYQTVLEEELCFLLDEDDYFCVAPRYSYITTGQSTVCYAYYVKDTIAYSLQDYLQVFAYDENSFDIIIKKSQLMNLVLVFETAQEKTEFDEYVKINASEYQKVFAEVQSTTQFSGPYIEGYDMARIEKEYYDSIALNKMLEEYRFAR